MVLKSFSRKIQESFFISKRISYICFNQLNETMNTQCKNCGSTMQSEVRPFTCDLTGMKHETTFGKCYCEKTSSYVKLPDSIQKRMKELDELERTCTALGLGDKIAGARHVLDLEIKSFLVKKETRINLGQFN
jgi:hypothetical protein